jgi:beta-galactosidase
MMQLRTRILSSMATSALALSLLFAAPTQSVAKSSDTFEVGNGTFLMNGKPFIIKAAEVHYPRIPRAYWDQRIKMCKSLGMNTLCVYVFWNIHEQKEGEFNFTDNNDLRAFIKLAQKNGMYVIVRPGPYVCAEWEMGGLPWWLLKKKDIKLREQDPYFMERLEIFEKKVGEQIGDLTVDKGGPIIMVQVENEYGSYGEDKPYIAAVRDIIRKSGFDKVQLFQCDWSSNFTKNGLDDLIWTMNFGTGANIDNEFRKLGQLRPESPKMCSEFWSGWFDKWGGRHETRGAKDMVDGMREMLQKGISFSLYMTHGGTNWGHWAGANSPGFAPDVTSYDYDAPINEAGQTTPKFWELREMMADFMDGKKQASVPKEIATTSFAKVEVKEFAPLFYGNSGLVTDGDKADLTFEAHDLGWGSMVYVNTLPEIPTQSILKINEAHDYAQVFLNNNYIGSLDRRNGEKTLLLPATKKGDVLTIAVEALGRINFGRAIKDFKGITGDVTISATIDKHDLTWTLKNWDMYRIDDEYATAVKALNLAAKNSTEGKEIADRMGKRGYYRGYFNINKVGDTFINVETWGKGQVYVNGHALGRFWGIGPQQTLYTPGCWLKKGKNEIIILDVVGPNTCEVEGLSKPIIDKLALSAPATHRKEGETLNLSGETPVYTGTFAAGNGWQEVKMDATASGRYVCIEMLNSHNDREYACIAEWYLLDAQGKRLSREPWTIAYADDEDITTGNKTADKIYDLQESTYWSTNKGVQFPHYIVIDLGKDEVISGFQYLPRMEQGAPESIKDYKIYVKSELFNLGN